MSVSCSKGSFILICCCDSNLPVSTCEIDFAELFLHQRVDQKVHQYKTKHINFCQTLKYWGSPSLPHHSLATSSNKMIDDDFIQSNLCETYSGRRTHWHSDSSSNDDEEHPSDPP